MKNEKFQLIIDNFKKGISNSPLSGFADMRNCDASSQGTLVANHKSYQISPVAVTGIFTADAATDIITTPNFQVTVGTEIQLGSGRPVTFTTTGTLPAGISLATIYYLVYVSATTYKLASTYALAEAGTSDINITDAGTGTHTITSLDMGAVKNITYSNPRGYVLYQDTNSRIWHAFNTVSCPKKPMVGNTLTEGSGKGLVIWKDYLFAFRDNKIDVMNMVTEVWTNNWQTLNTTAGTSESHYAIVGQDDAVYFCDGKYVGSIIEKAEQTFDPGNALTFTYNNKALDLPDEEIAEKLAELGKNLIIGTQSYKVYPWDRISSSFTYPIELKEKLVHSMITIDNLVYIFYGSKGSCSVTNGTVIEDAFILSDYVTKYSSTNVQIVIGGSDVYNNKLIFSAYISSGGSSEMAAIYSWNLETKALVIENIASVGSYGTAGNNVLIYGIFSKGNSVVYGWQSGTTYGIDSISNSWGRRYNNYEAYFESQLYVIGDGIKKETPHQIHIGLAKTLTSNQGIRVSYRTNLTDAYTVIATIVTSTHGALNAYEIPAEMNQASMVQLKVELKGFNLTTPELIYVKIE